ncbi:hypothetical protein GUITHDRAFT_146270 [Guillardia theta CCMP2712]|uniref:Uncharacterized protein n=1 Tax=Guillardia theta (strain CCMP2712) TaxID=905079 RepID=L1IIR2_GUITC|nr:hypothetical protein GUITHDRAFT_146270 [Guillardia theta CCMP2712]EKX35705.1 hypothetical protein GUITHDRAFT_146270 [Guillardia theta CCMP2712]|eukprot:XP_005822685.1 hypothetical protein GUITHDRAFT_146270 [Guillardia theta CCMP2712]
MPHGPFSLQLAPGAFIEEELDISKHMLIISTRDYNHCIHVQNSVDAAINWSNSTLATPAHPKIFTSFVQGNDEDRPSGHSEMRATITHGLDQLEINMTGNSINAAPPAQSSWLDWINRQSIPTPEQLTIVSADLSDGFLKEENLNLSVEAQDKDPISYGLDVTIKPGMLSSLKLIQYRSIETMGNAYLLAICWYGARLIGNQLQSLSDSMGEERWTMCELEGKLFKLTGVYPIIQNSDSNQPPSKLQIKRAFDRITWLAMAIRAYWTKKEFNKDQGDLSNVMCNAILQLGLKSAVSKEKDGACINDFVGSVMHHSNPATGECQWELHLDYSDEAKNKYTRIQDGARERSAAKKRTRQDSGLDGGRGQSAKKRRPADVEGSPARIRRPSKQVRTALLSELYPPQQYLQYYTDGPATTLKY